VCIVFQRTFPPSKTPQDLVVSSSHDLEHNVRIPASVGLAGYVATTGHFVNVKGAACVVVAFACIVHAPCYRRVL
jgi:hypothetical protein